MGLFGNSTGLQISGRVSYSRTKGMSGKRKRWQLCYKGRGLLVGKALLSKKSNWESLVSWLLIGSTVTVFHWLGCCREVENFLLPAGWEGSWNSRDHLLQQGLRFLRSGRCESLPSWHHVSDVFLYEFSQEEIEFSFSWCLCIRKIKKSFSTWGQSLFFMIGARGKVKDWHLSRARP